MISALKDVKMEEPAPSQPPPARRQRPAELSEKGFLPDYIVPQLYVVEISLFLSDTQTFKGETTLMLELKEAADSFFFHAGPDLFIKAIMVRNLRGDKLNTSAFTQSHHPTIPHVRELYLGKVFEPGIYYFKLFYVAKIYKEGDFGFVKRGSGSEAVFFTLLYPNHARYVFPCFDEPRFKATFRIRIEVDEGCHPISMTTERQTTKTEAEDITPVDGSRIKKSRIMTDFNVTKTISPSYVGWVIFTSPHRMFEVTTPSGIKIRNVYAKDYKKLTATEVGKSNDAAMEIFKTFTGTLPIDLDEVKVINFVEIPTLQEAQMNWCLAFVPMDILILDKKKEKIQIEEMTKIFAKMWMGIYVTANYWNDVWLLEGLAYLFANLHLKSIGIDKTVEYLKIRGEAMFYDSLQEVRALTEEVEDETAIGDYFNPNVIKKGIVLIRMLWQIDEIVFWTALRSIFNKFAFKTITSTQFYDFYERMTSPLFKQYTDGFRRLTEIPGVPAVRVVLYNTIDSRDPFKDLKRLVHTIFLKFEQRRFFTNCRGRADPFSCYPAFIDFFEYRLLKMPNDPRTVVFHNSFLEKDTKFKECRLPFVDPLIIEYQGVKPSSVKIFFNYNMETYQITEQHPKVWQEILKIYASKRIPIESCFNLLQDTTFTALSGQKLWQTDFSCFIDLFKLTRRMSSPIYWQPICTGLALLEDVLIHAQPEIRRKFSKLVFEVTEGVKIETPFRHLLMERIFKTRNPGVVKYFGNRFMQFMVDFEMPKQHMIKYLLTEFPVEHLLRMMRMMQMKEADYTPELKKEMLTSLAGPRPHCDNYSRRQLYLAFLEGTVPGDIMRALNLPKDTASGQAVLWDFFKANYETILERIGLKKFKEIFPHFVALQASDEIANEVETFCEQNFSKEVKKVMKYTLVETIGKIKRNATVLRLATEYFSKI